MAKNLVIVESPAKAKTIEKYLGADFKVVSSYGHIRDLPKKKLSIDVEHNFLPTYEIVDDKKSLVKELSKQVGSSDCVYLASDDDREGESISWHLKEALQIPESKIKRIVFREITKKAILQAIEKPRSIDDFLVDSQQARRILDRLVGYHLSPVLWRKVKRGLSAGRVQSVAVRMIVEREREIQNHSAISSFVTSGQFDLGADKVLNSELSTRFKSEGEVENFLDDCKNADFVIKNIEKKTGKRSPSAPFTTSTLQQDASSKLGFSVSQTMTLAQRLYEAGKISYMRTDSVNLSEEAIDSAKKVILGNFGDQYFQKRKYETKSANAQEAHEAIRPTSFEDQVGSTDKSEQKLYKMIWKRAIASQMKDAEIEKSIATINISTRKETLKAEGEFIAFEGFLKAYSYKSNEEDDDEDNHGVLPNIQIGQILNLKNLQSREKFNKPAARYTEASLVRGLEENGIGRPSTYAPTISTIQKRGYVVKEDRIGKARSYKFLKLENAAITKSTKEEIVGTEKQKLFPTDVALVTNDFLVENFPEITNYDFTAKVEEELDIIANGKLQWQTMMSGFYKKLLEQLNKTADAQHSSANSSRSLGEDPATHKEIFAKLGKYGAYVQLGPSNVDEQPKFASLRKDQRLETITLEEAIELFKLPKSLGLFEEEDMTVAIGRFGPYIKHKGLFYSIPKDIDPHSIKMDDAVRIIEDKKRADSEKIIKTFTERADLQILNGRWGPYIKFGDKNIKIPKSIENVRELSLEECINIVENNKK